MADKLALKGYFSKGSRPTAEQFGALIDSFYHVNDRVPMEQIDDIDLILKQLAELVSRQHEVQSNIDALRRAVDELAYRVELLERQAAPPLLEE